MGIVEVTASRATALVAPAHAQGHDGNYSQDNEGNHDHNDSRLDGHRNHQGLTLLLPLRRATCRPQDTRRAERRPSASVVPFVKERKVLDGNPARVLETASASGAGA
jgi:hypothetical protein